MLEVKLVPTARVMGNGVSQDQQFITENRQTKNSTQNTDNCSNINYSAEIKQVKRPQLPESDRPDISTMDEDEAYHTVCSEIDQALAGHYAFLFSNPTATPAEEKKPTLQQVDKLLEEQGFKNPDLTDATQKDLVKPYLQKKKTVSPQPDPDLTDLQDDSLWREAASHWSDIEDTANQTRTYETPPACKLPKKFETKRIQPKKKKGQQINEVLLNNRAIIAKEQSANLHRLGKCSPPKLDSIPKNMPSLDPIGIEGNRWVRPDSLVAEEAKALRKYKKTVSGEESFDSMHVYDRGYQPQVGSKQFDASKFAEANAKVKKDLDIYSETTYSRYKKSASHQDQQLSQDSMKRPQVSVDDLDLAHDPSMEKLLAEIEDEFK